MRNGFRQSFVTRGTRILSSFGVPALVGLGALLAGCSGDGAAKAPVTIPTADAITLTQANNFTSVSSLKPTEVTVAPGANLHICWDKLTVDIQGHTIDPTKDINDVSFIPANSSSEDEVANWLNTGQLGASKVGTTFEYQPAAGVTCANLGDFTDLGGNKLVPANDFKVATGVTYLMVFASGKKIGYGARTMLFLKPDPANADASEVAASNTSATLMYSADLHDLTRPQPHIDQAQVVDWSGIAKNAQGGDISASDIDTILVGFYKDKKVSDLESGFLNLEEATEAMGGPTRSWQLTNVTGQRADLSKATGRLTEGAFTNFETTDTGTWLLGMFCGSCTNPAPEIVTILDPK